MDSSTLLFRAGLFSCALLLGQLPVYAQADTGPDEWTPSQRAEMEADYKVFKADSIRMAEVMREEEAGVEVHAFSDSTVYTPGAVDQLPQLPGGGGQEAIIQAIKKAFRYPLLAIKKKREGVATVSIIVDENGRPTNLKVVNGLGYGIDEDLIRAIGTLPRFIPAYCSGYAVRVSLTLPITLKIQ